VFFETTEKRTAYAFQRSQKASTPYVAKIKTKAQEAEYSVSSAFFLTIIF